MDRHIFPSSPSFVRSAKWAIHALIISGMLNIALLVTFGYFVWKDQSFQKNTGENREISLERKERSLPPKLEERVSIYLHSSFEDLLLALEDETHIEQGQLASDLALACLVRKHFLDYKRALADYPLSKRIFTFYDKEEEKEKVMTLFTGISSDQRRALREFIKKEVWPLTAEGLFVTMQQKEGMIPLSLQQAFFLSSEQYVIQKSFHQLEVFLSPEELLELLLERKWTEIEELAENLTKQPTKRKEILRLFCFQLFKSGQAKAASFLLEIDPDFVLKVLTNKEFMLFLSKIEKYTPATESFLLKVATGLRPDSIREEAKRIIQAYKEAPKKKDSVVDIEEKEEKKSIVYTVKFGDTLWKISRQFHLPVSQIKEENSLKSDTLLQGQILIIPLDS